MPIRIDLARIRPIGRRADALPPPSPGQVASTQVGGWRSALHLALVAGSFLLPACFVEPTASTLFRYECEAKEDCPEGESCTNGICEKACAFTENSDLVLGDCPRDEGYMACVQGYCANSCDASESECPGLQSCVALPGSEFTGQSISVCTVACGPDQPCAAGELCLAGICTPLSTGGESGMTDSAGTGTGTGGTGA